MKGILRSACTVPFDELALAWSHRLLLPFPAQQVVRYGVLAPA